MAEDVTGDRISLISAWYCLVYLAIDVTWYL